MIQTVRVPLVALVITATFIATACAHAAPAKLLGIKAGEKSLQVEVMATPEGRSKGMMGRTSMADTRGMLFVFARPTQTFFWMKNCLMDIDVAFIDEEGVIQRIHEMKVESPMVSETALKRYPSPPGTFYALETRGGWFRAHDVKTGQKLTPIEALRAIKSR
jgi:uncharacterized membrane protein (UPF0127 family)